MWTENWYSDHAITYIGSVNVMQNEKGKLSFSGADIPE
jgi:hypothetical protein